MTNEKRRAKDSFSDRILANRCIKLVSSVVHWMRDLVMFLTVLALLIFADWVSWAFPDGKDCNRGDK